MVRAATYRPNPSESTAAVVMCGLIPIKFRDKSDASDLCDFVLTNKFYAKAMCLE